MPWYTTRALSGCAICGGLAGDVLSVEAAQEQLINRGHAVRSQFDLYRQGRGSAASVRTALQALEGVLRSARERIQLGRGAYTVGEMSELQDTYRRTEYTFNETTRLLEAEAGPGAAPPGALPPSPGTPPPGGKVPGTAPGTATPWAGGGPPGEGFSLATVTEHPVFWPAVIGVGAIGATLLLMKPKPKPKGK